MIPETLKMIDRQETDHDITFKVETTTPPSFCPKCGSVGAKLYRFGVKNQLFMDLPIHGKRVGLVVARQRYRCRDCQATFFELLPGMEDGRFMTKRLVQFIKHQSLKDTFTRVADDTGLDEKTVRNLFHEYIKELQSDYQFIYPEWLGIDEIYVLKKPRCILTNVREQTIIDLLPNRSKENLISYFGHIDIGHRLHIEIVTMDMWNPYRDVVLEMLPKAKIVVDKFHVQRMADLCLETVRKGIRDRLNIKQRRTLMHDRYVLHKRKSTLTMPDTIKLEGWLGIYPELKTAYTLKEWFYTIWDCETRNDAESQYDAWLNNVPASQYDVFKVLIKTVDNWRNEIFAYFDHRVTNAYTESLNNVIRSVNRMGRGYSFEVIRAKMLYSAGLHKIYRPSYQVPGGFGIQFASDLRDNYGAELSTLANQLLNDKI